MSAAPGTSSAIVPAPQPFFSAAADDGAAADAAAAADVFREGEGAAPPRCWGGHLSGVYCAGTLRMRQWDGDVDGKYFCDVCWERPKIPAERVRLASEAEKGWKHPSTTGFQRMPWHWLGSVPQMLQRPDQRRCGKVYDVQDCKAAKPEDGAPAAFVSPRAVSAADSQLIQSRYPHWFEERDGRLCLKLTACRRQAPKRSGKPMHLLPSAPPPTDAAASTAAGPAAAIAVAEQEADEADEARRKRQRRYEPVPQSCNKCLG